jgi:hypothetical protein
MGASGAGSTQPPHDFGVVLEGTPLLEALRPLADVKKDQYETTVDFTKRVCTATAKALGVDASSRMTFVLEHGKYATFEKYDADKRSFFVKLGTEIHYKAPEAPYDDRWRWEPPIDKFKFNSVWLARKFVQAPTTVAGRNAFGVTKDVKVGREDMVVLFFPTRSFDTQFQFIGTRISLPASPDMARKLDGDLRVAIVGRLHPPCFVAGRSHTSPTLSYPYDQSTSESGIVINPNPEWLLFRASTKEILKRGTFK